MFAEIGSKVSCGRVGIVTTNGVEYVDAIFCQLVCRNFEWVFTVFNQASLDAVFDIG